MKIPLLLILLLYKSRLTWSYSLAYKNYKNYNYDHHPPSPNPGDFIYTPHPNGGGAFPPGVQGPYGYFFYKNFSAPDNRPGGSIALTDILPADIKSYDKNRPPKTSDRNATVVYFHVTVLSIDSIDEESMTYVADVFLAQTWRDDRLRLPHKMDDNYRILDVQWLNSIWRPDCFFKNAKSVTFHEMSVPNHYLWLHNDKTLLYMSKLTLVLSCAMKFETFPHDTQVCSMQIESCKCD